MDHSTVTICRKSRSISKQKARVVHIYEPVIIKTDPANFRELVQRLTGKEAATKIHGGSHEEMKKKKKKKAEDTENLGRGLPWRNLELLEEEREDEKESWSESCSAEFLNHIGDMDLFFHGLYDSPDFLSNVFSFSYLEEI